MYENTLSGKVIKLAFEVHSALGPGLLESAYSECLYFEILESGLSVRKEVPMPLVYKTIKMNQGYRMDLLVENKLVIEIKTVECFTDVHYAQLLTYLRLGGYRLGLLLNFHTTSLKDGIKRVIN